MVSHHELCVQEPVSDADDLVDKWSFNYSGNTLTLPKYLSIDELLHGTLLVKNTNNGKAGHFFAVTSYFSSISTSCGITSISVQPSSEVTECLKPGGVYR
jgi:hypothetical protein